MYILITDFLFYVTDASLFDVLLKVCSKPKVETGHLVLLLNIYVQTGVSPGSSSDLRETKDAFLLQALDWRNLPSEYFFCLGNVCNQIAIL